MSRPYVTARSASELLGVPYLTVIDDVRDGMDGSLPALIGGESGGTWFVAAFEVMGERLEMHRARLTRTDTSTVAVPELPLPVRQRQSSGGASPGGDTGVSHDAGTP